MKSDQSVPLSEALERFSDPSDWEELRLLESCEYHVLFAGRAETEYDAPALALPQAQGTAGGGVPGQADCRLSASKRPGLADRTERQASDSSRRDGGISWSLTSRPRRRPAAGFASSIFGFRRHSLLAAAHPVEPGGRTVPREHRIARQAADRASALAAAGGAGRGQSWQKKHYCTAARTRFGDRVTNNLFNEVWRSADLPEALRRPGLRKVDDHLAGSSPPADPIPKTLDKSETVDGFAGFSDERPCPLLRRANAPLRTAENTAWRSRAR